MHTVELLEQATATAERLGYRVRQEWLGGCRGGACQVGDQKWIFLDLSLSASERLDQIVEALQEDYGIYRMDLPASLARLLGVRRSA